MDSISSRRGPRPEVDTYSQDRDSQETAQQALLLQGPLRIRWGLQTAAEACRSGQMLRESMSSHDCGCGVE